MTTPATMKARIAAEIMDDNLGSQITTAVADAIRFYERRTFYFNTHYVTFNTVSDQEFYGGSDHAEIPGLLRILSMQADRHDMTVFDPDAMESLQDGLAKAEPRSFAYVDQQIRLYPIPNAVYSIRARWVYRLPSIEDGETNAWFDDAEPLIRNRAKALICTDVTLDDNMASKAMAREAEALEALVRESRRRASNDTLRTDIQSGGRFNIYRGH